MPSPAAAGGAQSAKQTSSAPCKQLYTPVTPQPQNAQLQELMGPMLLLPLLLLLPVLSPAAADNAAAAGDSAASTMLSPTAANGAAVALMQHCCCEFPPSPVLVHCTVMPAVQHASGLQYCVAKCWHPTQS
jgi:hypothetical protein